MLHKIGTEETLCAQVSYLCFVLLLYIHSFVTEGSCSWLHLVHSLAWDGMEGGGFWGCRPSHLNASMSVAVSLLTAKHYEIWPPQCSFGKLNFNVSFTVGHNFWSVFMVPVGPGCHVRTPKPMVCSKEGGEAVPRSPRPIG